MPSGAKEESGRGEKGNPEEVWVTGVTLHWWCRFTEQHVDAGGAEGDEDRRTNLSSVVSWFQFQPKTPKY